MYDIVVAARSVPEFSQLACSELLTKVRSGVESLHVDVPQRVGKAGSVIRHSPRSVARFHNPSPFFVFQAYPHAW